MWRRLSLRARIFLILSALLLTTLGGGLVTMWHTEAMDHLFTSLVDQNVASLQAAQELESALLIQRGLTTYFFLDGNPDWLKQLEQYHQSFLKGLAKARKGAHTEAMGELLGQIEVQYPTYVAARGEVIRLYQAGDKQAGVALHPQVRRQFSELLSLCQRLSLMQEYAISRARTEARARARFINATTLVAIPGVALLGALLAYILLKQILGPIRQLALAAAPETPGPDEVKALSHRVYRLMENVDEAQSQLTRSQEHLIQSGKWALVGKLAAGVAHSIRNPLTSVKMRLFSMERTLKLTPTQREDLEVISEEIRHIDTIVRNFLEFSRPPKLKVQRLSPSDVVDMALQLMRPRLESYGVAVQVERTMKLPEIQADPEQLKEVLVNLLVNACEAMPAGGFITIKEEEGVAPEVGRVVIIRVSDNGPGIPPNIQDQVFQPFFSTKEEGTGLGLAIASRIVEDHGGWIDLTSREGAGTTFSLTLPFGEHQAWVPSSS
jgi:signal transduction histidine kinase